MHKSGLTAAVVLVATALPFALATGAAAQSKATLGGGGGARVAPAAPAGGGMKGGMVGSAVGSGFRGGAVGVGPRVGGPPIGIATGGRKSAGIVAGAGPRPVWSGPRRGGWHGHHHRRHGRWIGPGIGFSTGLLLGGAYATSPYYYDDPYYYYDDSYIDSRIYSRVGASPDEIAYCKRRFKSYDVRSRTYLGYDGERHPCP